MTEPSEVILRAKHIHSRQSGALTGEATDRFVVRIATAVGGGIETSNTDYVTAIPNSDEPAKPTLTATLV